MDRGLEVGDLTGHLRPIGEICALTVLKKRTELAELVLLVEIERTPTSLAQAA